MSLWVKVYAGPDLLTGKRHDLTEVVPPGPRAAARAEKVGTLLLRQADEQRNRPWTMGADCLSHVRPLA